MLHRIRFALRFISRTVELETAIVIAWLLLAI